MSMHVDSSACAKGKGESEQFRIVGWDRGVTCLLGCLMFIWMD